MSSRKGWQDVDFTRDEFERVTTALKNDEFKKMFFDYCEEIQDPENRKKYEEEITQLEAERGVEIQFLNPEPGFVVKTSADGNMKAFVNIAKTDKVERPRSQSGINPNTGKPGLSWSIPLAQAPPRRDVDNSGKECVVYDVMFHPEALHLSEKNEMFRKHLISTACDAIEREFNVKLDRTNVKFPKLKFKGVARPVVMRKMSKEGPTNSEPSPIDSIYPPLPTENDSNPKVFSSGASKEVDKYTTPKHVIKHRRGVDLSEMTYEIDAKLNVTIPKELVVEIELPLLKSTSNCSLDVTERRLYLVSESPAKYKLCLDLPFPVNDKEGSAKFDQDSRRLTIVLPVCPEKERRLKDLYREDSGVESDVKDESGCISPDHSESPLIQVLHSEENQLPKEDFKTPNPEDISMEDKFLKDSIKYNFPSHFDCNTLDENLAFTLHVKNVDPQSVECINGNNFVHMKFTSIGSGYYPTHYAFYVALPEDSEASITSFEAETWDNNVILTLALNDYENLKSYHSGLDGADLKEYPISEQFTAPSKRFSLLQEKEEFEISVERSEDQVQIDIKPTKNDIAAHEEQDDDDEKAKENKKPSGGKKQKKKNKKRRSLSESSCDEFKSNDLVNTAKQSDLSKSVDSDDFSPSRKVRSSSECRENGSVPIFKGILKHRSRYGRSISESCSSMDELPFSCSVDLPLSDSFGDIPEEDDPHHQELSESCKKTVRFSDVIRKQLFRLDSSILGQRKKNQKKRSQKQRALQRRNSEGDSPEYFDKAKRPPMLSQQKNKKPSQHDSGLDLSENIEHKDSKNPDPRERIDSESSDMEGKNSLMFDMEM